MINQKSSVSQRAKIGLALGGGAVRGFAHVGILQELERAEIPIDYIAGTSAGALVGAMYASGVSPQEMIEMGCQLSWKELFIPQPGLKNFLSGKPLITLLERHCRARRFEELYIPFSVVVSHLETGQSVSISTGDMFPAIQASCSIPLVFPPVMLNGQEYIDGGFASIIPVETVKKMGADIVIACDVNYQATAPGSHGNFLTMLMHLMLVFIQKDSEESKHQADVAINVDAKGISLIAIHKVRELLERGRQATAAILPGLQQLIQEKSG